MTSAALYLLKPSFTQELALRYAVSYWQSICRYFIGPIDDL
jgi:hypothetical protein